MVHLSCSNSPLQITVLLFSWLFADASGMAPPVPGAPCVGPTPRGSPPSCDWFIGPPVGSPVTGSIPDPPIFAMALLFMFGFPIPDAVDIPGLFIPGLVVIWPPLIWTLTPPPWLTLGIAPPTEAGLTVMSPAIPGFDWMPPLSWLPVAMEAIVLIAPWSWVICGLGCLTPIPGLPWPEIYNKKWFTPLQAM